MQPASSATSMAGGGRPYPTMSPKKKVLPPKPKLQSLVTTPGDTRVTKLPHKPMKKPSSGLTEERFKKSPDSKSTVTEERFKKSPDSKSTVTEERSKKSPDSRSTVTEERSKKSPDSKSTVANLVLAVGTVFSATSPTNPEVDALWSFDSDTVENCSAIEDNPCTYNNHPLEKASTTNPLLTAKDPFLAIKSPPRTPSIDDLWSSEALFNSSEPLADPSDPLTQFVNPLEAEGFKPDAFEKSRLRSMSKVPIEAEKSVSEKESSYQVHVKIEKDNSNLPSEKEVVTERLAAEPTEGILEEFKSEPNSESSSQEELSTKEEKINLTPEADIVKAEFICANEMAPCLPMAPQSNAQDADMDLMEYILNDDIQPDQEFVQSAEQTLQQMQIQTIELSDIYEDPNIQNINQMVDPMVVTEIAGNSVHQPGTPGWNQSGGCVTVMSSSVEHHQQQEPHNQVDCGPEVPEDLLESLVKKFVTVPEHDATEASANAVEYFSEPQVVEGNLDAAATSESTQPPSPPEVEVIERRPRRTAARKARAQPVEVTPAEHRRAPRMTLADPEEKYRRMRDLNNDASKRCRENRKRKLQQLQEDLVAEEQRNQTLKLKLRLLEEAKEEAKRMFLQSIAKGARISFS